jgi:small subunit ribosomal protein S4
MGRYIGPSCRLCRREGMKLFLKGSRCYMAKCPVAERKRSAPGMHGARGRKLSDYGQQLREKQRLKRFYGLQEGQFRLFFERALQKRGVTGETLLQLLEMRLDNVIYRLGFAASRKASRQFVLHRHIKINGRIVNIPSMQVKPGSKLEVIEDGRAMAKAVMETGDARGHQVPAWMILDKEHCAAEILRAPTRDEIAPFVNEQLVVELYSK